MLHVHPNGCPLQLPIRTTTEEVLSATYSGRTLLGQGCNQCGRRQYHKGDQSLAGNQRSSQMNTAAIAKIAKIAKRRITSEQPYHPFMQVHVPGPLLMQLPCKHPGRHTGMLHSGPLQIAAPVLSVRQEQLPGALGQMPLVQPV